MSLAYIERGTRLSINAQIDQCAISDAFDAVFKYQENDSVFAVQCCGLYEIYDSLDGNATLNINFSDELVKYTFTGRVMERKRGGGLIMIEQLTDVERFNLRQYVRDEIRVDVLIYELSCEELDKEHHEKPVREPDLWDKTFDISSGGLCVVTNKTLNPEHDPLYLLEFKLSDNDWFILPASIVRRSNNPQTKIGKYDYGFQFIFDSEPEEKGRLTMAILRKKLKYR